MQFTHDELVALFSFMQTVSSLDENADVSALMQKIHGHLDANGIHPDYAVKTITESEAAEAVASAVSVDEAEAVGIDTAAAEAEATPVEVVADEPAADVTA